MSTPKKIQCPSCGAPVKLPKLWKCGIEIVIRCPQCNRPMKTGFKMGAFLSGVSLALALGIANLVVFLIGSFSIPLIVLTVIPLWLIFACNLRLWWMKYKYRRIKRKSER